MITYLEQFYKARKQLALFSGLLLAWVLIGIKPDNLGDGTLGAIFKAIETPAAIPLVLAVLILYFIFRLCLIWQLCPDDGKSRWEAKLDFRSTWILGVLAVVLYLGQETYQGIRFGESATRYVAGIKISKINILAMVLFLAGYAPLSSLYPYTMRRILAKSLIHTYRIILTSPAGIFHAMLMLLSGLTFLYGEILKPEILITLIIFSFVLVFLGIRAIEIQERYKIDENTKNYSIIRTHHFYRFVAFLFKIPIQLIDEKI